MSSRALVRDHKWRIIHESQATDSSFVNATKAIKMLGKADRYTGMDEFVALRIDQENWYLIREIWAAMEDEYTYKTRDLCAYQGCRMKKNPEGEWGLCDFHETKASVILRKRAS